MCCYIPISPDITEHLSVQEGQLCTVMSTLCVLHLLNPNGASKKEKKEPNICWQCYHRPLVPQQCAVPD